MTAMARDLDRLRDTDAKAGIAFTRLLLHIWPIVAGVATWRSDTWSTETHQLVGYGLPHWSLSVGLMGGGIVLILARVGSRLLHSNWVFVLGDFAVGAACLMMSAVMFIAAMHQKAGYISFALWLFVGLMYQLHTVIRLRGTR
jgi:hypothetical protein